MTLVDEMPSKDLIYDQLLLLIIFTRDFFFCQIIKIVCS